MGILIKPVLSEKQTAISDKYPNRYAFRVVPSANKVDIKNAVEQMYNVEVVRVNTLHDSVNRKSRYTKSGVISGKTSAFKKAIVFLKESQIIDFFSNI